MNEDPLAPPDGYGHTEETPDFTWCCTGCGNPTREVVTLGCSRGEHVGDFGYCNAHRVGPFWCGRCRVPGRKDTPMKVLKRVPYISDTERDQVVSSLDRLFDRKRMT